MNLYLVKTADAGVDLWVAYETADGDLYVYVQNTGKFHRNAALEEDFYVDQEFTYEPITAAAALEIVAAGTVGKLGARTKSAQVRRYEDDANTLDAAPILGVTRTRSEADIRAARVKALRNAKPGVPVTWKKYPAAKAHLARVAVTDIKRSKIKALKPLGQLDAWVENDAGDVLVRIARPTGGRGATISAATVAQKKVTVRRSAGKKVSAV